MARLAVVHDPGAGEGGGIFENLDLVVFEHDRVACFQFKQVGARPAAGGEIVRDDDVARVEQIQQRRGQAARQNLGVVIVLGLVVERVEELHVAGQLDRVVALHVVESPASSPAH